LIDHSSIVDLLAHPKVVETQNHIHHSIPKYDHLMRSVRYSYRLAPVLRADRRICMRAAILHDIDSRYGTLTTHGSIAARWAASLGECERVCHVIESHMYPFGPAPKTREAWVLVIADKLASLSDMTHFVGGLFTGKSIAERRRLRSSDPFFASRKPLVRRVIQRFGIGNANS
jgi:putative nucleotidyltransferase with HDIG domain